MKGTSALVASVMLVLIAVVASVFVSGWLSSTTERETGVIRNTTKEQLQCQYADLYVKSAVYNCADDCTAGVGHVLNLTVVNSGKRSLSLNRIFVNNLTGSVTELTLPDTVLNVGDIISISNTSTDTCYGINNSIEYVRISSLNCPTSYDNFEGSRITYVDC